MTRRLTVHVPMPDGWGVSPERIPVYRKSVLAAAVTLDAHPTGFWEVEVNALLKARVRAAALAWAESRGTSRDPWGYRRGQYVLLYEESDPVWVEDAVGLAVLLEARKRRDSVQLFDPVLCSASRRHVAALVWHSRPVSPEEAGIQGLLHRYGVPARMMMTRDGVRLEMPAEGVRELSALLRRLG